MFEAFEGTTAETVIAALIVIGIIFVVVWFMKQV